LRVALIGYGLAGEAFHAPLIAAEPGLELATVVTSSDGRAGRARDRHPGVRVVADAERLHDGDGAHDVVVVATPNRTHVPLARSALEAGAAVVVDKPLAARAEEARELAALAADRNLLLTVFHNRRWDGDMLTVQRLIGEGELGSVLRFESRFDRWRPRIKAGWRERDDPAEAGGVLFDLGSHLIDQALVLFGPPRRVYAELAVRRPDAGVVDDAFVALEHDDDVRVQLWMSQTAAQPGPRFRVLGSRAAYVKWGLDGQEAALRAGGRPDEEGWGREPRELWGRLGSEDDAQPVETAPGDYARFYAGVAAALRDGAPPPVPVADAIAVLEVIEAAVLSAGDARVIELPPADAAG
jgi:predicted dehydrogenase